MYTVRVKLKDLDEGMRFTSIAQGFIDDVDLTEGSISIDGKSIVGIGYLPYPCEMNAVLHCDTPSTCNIFDIVMHQFSIERESKS